MIKRIMYMVGRNTGNLNIDIWLPLRSKIVFRLTLMHRLYDSEIRHEDLIVSFSAREPCFERALGRVRPVASSGWSSLQPQFLQPTQIGRLGHWKCFALKAMSCQQSFLRRSSLCRKFMPVKCPWKCIVAFL